MREIVTLQIGGAGNSIADGFWHVISHEHGLDYNTGRFQGTSPLQLQRMEVFFNLTASKRFYARTICADTESGTVQRLRQKSGLYRPDNFVSGEQSAGNNFAKAYYTDGADMLSELLDKTRREAESTDSLQGFQILHSIGGGTGAGLTALALNSLATEYPDNLITNYVSIPTFKQSQAVVEPYNALLAMPSLINNSHLTFCLDNEALFQICNQNLKLEVAGFDHINHIVALTMSGITTCLRFPGQLNSGLRKIYVNMVPFPHLHFLVPGFAPLMDCAGRKYAKGTVGELVQQIFSSNNLLCAIDLTKGKLLTAAGIFRGRMSPRQVDQLMTNVRNKNISHFVEWIPNNIKTAICDIPPRGLTMSATFIGNTTAIAQVFQRILDTSNAMFRRKAHLHWFTGEGMEEREFVDAMEEVKGLIKDYKESGTDTNGDDDHGGKSSPTKCPHCAGF